MRRLLFALALIAALWTGVATCFSELILVPGPSSLEADRERVGVADAAALGPAPPVEVPVAASSATARPSR